MILSHKNKFIFIKTRKTAGTSFEIALSQYCDENDVVTRLSVEEDYYRYKLYKAKAQNFYYPLGEVCNVIQNFVKFKKVINCIKNPSARKLQSFFYKYCDHMTAKEVKESVSSFAWDNYYKFAIERNPWDKAVSRYYWDISCDKRHAFMDINDHIMYLAHEKPERISNWNMYADNDNIIVDDVFLYEDFNKILQKISNLLSCEKFDLPVYKAKSNLRKDRRHYRDLLNSRSIQIISDLCYREINAFGYNLEY